MHVTVDKGRRATERGDNTKGRLNAVNGKDVQVQWIRIEKDTRKEWTYCMGRKKAERLFTRGKK